MSYPQEDLDCDERLNAAAYVLDALDEPDPYRAHVAGCPTCRAEVAELRSVVDALPETVPLVAAPEALRDRVLAAVRSEAELLRAAAGPASDTRVAAKRLRRTPRPLLTAWLAGAACIAVALAIAFNGGASAPKRVFSAQVADTVQGAHASLRIVGGHAELTVSNMPPPTLGRTYEVWLNRGALPLSTDALFSVTNRGRASVDVPGSLHGVTQVMVTSEPFGGSSSPTGPPLLVISVHA
jgi:hypothetical protein